MLDVIQDVLIVIVTALENSLESKIYIINVIIVIYICHQSQHWRVPFFKMTSLVLAWFGWKAS